MKFICYGVRGSRPTPYNNANVSQLLAKLLLDHGIDEIERIITESKKIVATSEKKVQNNTEFLTLQSLIQEKINQYNKSFINIACNTPCLEVRGDSVFDTQIIFDLGTGTSQAEILSTTRNLHIFFTHFHYDHVQGMPFFGALFNPNLNVHFYSAVKGFERYLTELMHHPYFPVTMSETMSKKMTFHQLKGTAPIKINGMQITWKEINHPGGSYAYKVTSKNKSFCYFSDVCVTDVLFKPSQFNKDFLENIDAMVLDGAMCFEDSIIKKYWGHSSFYTGIDFAHFWNIKSLHLFHFDPMDNIATMPVLYQTAQWYKKSIKASVDINLAEEARWIEV